MAKTKGDKPGKQGKQDKQDKPAQTGDGKRVELVEPVPETDHRAQRMGLALLASLVIGFDPLRDAATGNGSFANAIGRYLACLAVSVAAAVVLGRLLDGAPPPPDEEPDGNGGDGDPVIGDDQRVAD